MSETLANPAVSVVITLNRHEILFGRRSSYDGDQEVVMFQSNKGSLRI